MLKNGRLCCSSGMCHFHFIVNNCCIFTMQVPVIGTLLLLPGVSEFCDKLTGTNRSQQLYLCFLNCVVFYSSLVVPDLGPGPFAEPRSRIIHIFMLKKLPCFLLPLSRTRLQPSIESIQFFKNEFLPSFFRERGAILDPLAQVNIDPVRTYNTALLYFVRLFLLVVMKSIFYCFLYLYVQDDRLF